MKWSSTLLLKAALALMAVPVLLLCLFIVPQAASFAALMVPEFPGIGLLVYAVFYGSAVPYFSALYQAYRLLRLIDRKEAFSAVSVGALTKIKYCGMAITLIYAAGMPLFYLVADADDAPGLIVIGLFILAASFIIAVFAAVLERLLREAVDMKTEQEFTV
ncbi:DUF2975 domain-containing protein [Alkalicoccus urumqiensis]|uniref:DUF2975 domain-containing protein n=1 Tax=Alkalicoccus urumqiensis TaxID=1548213 RepID=A0A2P6MJ83_ALKUR|nr:DUF2975 domain-containing protein [Alkalicoccus urumqiensis]PRO66335.1 DUF2975 domain-containing protein [Alkalicoccus urumqiensis]